MPTPLQILLDPISLTVLGLLWRLDTAGSAVPRPRPAPR